MARRERNRPSRGLDAELAQLIEDPDSVGYQPLPSRRVRMPRGPRARVRTNRRPSPIFLGLVLATAGGGALAALEPSGSRAAGIGVFIFILAGWLVSVCLHEFAHAFVAYRGGDHSVVGADYLRLNPFRYAHPLLSIVLPLVWIVYGGIGLPGGAVLIQRHQLRSRVWESAVSAAGPAVNIVVAAVALTSLRFFSGPAVGQHGFELYAAIGWFAWLQIAVSILNLVPIPGLDGWGILEPWLPSSTVHAVAKIKPFGLLLVVAILWTPAINSGFSHLISDVATGLGDPDGLPWFGSQLFKFWSH